uniref:Enhancer of polycomb-like protein n=1 Tax=Noccaea caerulescens TaxID=107243 RepID=A0A1J3I8X6_NOCCA
MPSVGMRRTTRVFGVVKAADGARVLRSGRRIWPNVDEPKVKRAHDVVDRDWNSVLKNPNKGKGNKISGKSNGAASKPCSPREISTEKDDIEDDFPISKRRKVKSEAVGDEKTVDTMFGIVYSRKRKRLSDQSSSKSEVPQRSLKFYRRRRRLSDRVSSGRLSGPVITLTADGSCEECWFSTVFRLVMRYSRREQLRLSSLASFFLSQPISEVFANHGVRFISEPSLSSRGVCKFFGAMNCLPLFTADFSAIPRCFMDMHFALFLRVAPRSFVFVKKSLHLLNNPVEESDSESEIVLSEPCTPRNDGVVGLNPSVRATAQCKSNLGFHSFQKRRSSLRRRRARNLPHSVHKLYNGTSVSDLSASLKNRTAAVPPRKLRSSVISNSSPCSNGISIIPKPKTKEELDSLCCSANILMIGSDRCTREEGFSAMLEFSSSKEWFIVIKKDGAIRYSHKARKTMRPCSCNRFTHSIVWIGDNDWKLEFCDRQDWVGFKELYKECYERNVLEQNAKVIPIPGVREVCGYAEDFSDFPSFSMPVPYISVQEDEVSRAMARSIAIYDMDSEDEEWLDRQNREMSGVEDEQLERLQQDTFELMIDGFEKCYFHSPSDDLLDEKEATIASLTYLGRQEVVEAVHDYWARKRKQRKAPLLRVFQGHQVKKTSLVFKPVFRKRRSFKRQGSQLHGKAKQLSLVGVKSAEQEASEEQDVYLRVEEAKALADSAMEIAIAKRRRAQVLAENADLAVYKAMMALRIAEAVKVAESSEVATNLFLN